MTSAVWDGTVFGPRVWPLSAHRHSLAGFTLFATLKSKCESTLLQIDSVGSPLGSRKYPCPFCISFSRLPHFKYATNVTRRYFRNAKLNTIQYLNVGLGIIILKYNQILITNLTKYYYLDKGCTKKICWHILANSNVCICQFFFLNNTVLLQKYHLLFHT